MTVSCVMYLAGEEFYGEGLCFDPEMLLEFFNENIRWKSFNENEKYGLGQ